MTKYINPFQAEYDTNGEPLVGGKLNFYEAGTTTRTPVYSDEELTTALSNPVIADEEGRFTTMYMQKILYKIVLTDANNVVVKTVDDYDFTNATLFNDIKQYATTTVSGVVILATASDVIEGTSDTKVVTPASIVDSLNALEIIPKGYINGGVLTYNTANIIDISDCLAKSSNEAEKIDIIGNSLDISVAGDWANGVVPSLTDASIFVWADYNSGSDRFILDNVTGSNITGEKRRVGSFITDNSDNIIPFTGLETTGGSIKIDYDSAIEELSSSSAVLNVALTLVGIPSTATNINCSVEVDRTGGGGDFTGIVSTDANSKKLVQLSPSVDFTSATEIPFTTLNEILRVTRTGASGSIKIYTKGFIDERVS